MSEQAPQLTNLEMRILYILSKHGGAASFNRILTECGMCYGMFHNNAEKLIEKGLVEKGETFKDYLLTRRGREVIMQITGICEPK
ncbi:MAG: MarR family winged helix-turn-helix transcriptional regulator [Candidatus Methanosuratincola petrocarbonis]